MTFLEKIKLAWEIFFPAKKETSATISQGMSLDELFDFTTKYIASPHTAITEHDKRRAILIFLAFDEFMLDEEKLRYLQHDNIDFGAYATKQLDILEGK
jgi:hypothetical protein